jgi:mycothiol synthase
MLEVRPVTSDEDRASVVRIVSTVTPDNPTSIEEMRWQEEKYPGGRRFIAWLDGAAVGTGGAGRVYVYPPEFDGLWGTISVLADHRRTGVGSAILVALSDIARAAGKSTLMGLTTADQTATLEFLEHRGFQVTERMKVVRLALARLQLAAVEPPDGIVITSLEERPDLVDGVYAVALEALPDIPGERPMAPGSLEEFRVRDVDRPSIPLGAFAVAIDVVTGQVAGYANLLMHPGSTRLAFHGMTAVARAWRGHGLATALKRATITWAAEQGLEALDGANDIENAPMRAVNKRLGYQPQPDELYYRGPVTPSAVTSR